MKNIFTLILLLLSSIAMAQTPCSFDASYNSGGTKISNSGYTAEDVKQLPNGKILVAANRFGDGYAFLQRFNNNGSIDITYGSAGKRIVQVAERNTNIKKIAIHNNITYVCGITTTNIGGTNTYAYVAAIDSGGTLVSSFGTNGYKKFNQSPDLRTLEDIEIGQNGEIFLAGAKSLTELIVMRIGTNGWPVTSFGSNGYSTIATNNNNKWYEVFDLLIDKNNRLVISGKKYRANNGNSDPAFQNSVVARFNSNGSIDNTFGTSGVGLYNHSANTFDTGKKLLETPDGDYLICGDHYNGTDYDVTVFKTNPTGNIISSFGTNGWAVHDLDMDAATNTIHDAALMNDGRILTSGLTGDGDTVYFSMLMLNSDGSRNSTFAPNGVFKNIFGQNNNSGCSSMDVTNAGKIVLAGYTRTCANGVCGPISVATARYNGATATAPNSVQEINNKNTIKIYPNPVGQNQTVTISIPNEKVTQVLIRSLYGRVVQSTSNFSNNSIMLNSFPKGLYLALISTDKGTYTAKILVE